MALQAGFLTVTLEYGKDLKDRDWFGRQDPYAIIQIGAQRLRSRTATDGGRNPVWNQSFRVPIVNENSMLIELWDADVASRDDHIGTAIVDLARARMQRTDRVVAPVVGRRHGKQRGILSVSLAFEPNAATQPYAQPPPQPYSYAPTYAQPPAPYIPPAVLYPSHQPVAPPAPAGHGYGYGYSAPSAPPTGPSYYPAVPATQQWYPAGGAPPAPARCW